MWLLLTSLACAAALGAPPPATIPAAPMSGVDSLPLVIVVADSTPLLTVDALTRMTTFWTAFLQAPPAVRDTGSAQVANRERIEFSITLRGEGYGYTTEVVNMVALAAKYPAVAADFTQAGLTPQQWERWRNALMAARGVHDLLKLVKPTVPPAPTSVVGKNLTFLTVVGPQFPLLQTAVEQWNGPNN